MFEEKGYRTVKGTMKIAFDRAVPDSVIKQVVTTHVKMNE